MSVDREKPAGNCGAALRVEPARCIVSGLCSLTAPDLFAHRDDGIAVAKVPTVPAGQEGVAEEAALECPSGAIEIGDS